MVDLPQIDVVFASQYTSLEPVQAHSSPIANLVASKPLDSKGLNVISRRQRLVSVGEDGEVRVWAIQLEDDHLLGVEVEELLPVTLQLLFRVRSYFGHCVVVMLNVTCCRHRCKKNVQF